MATTRIMPLYVGKGRTESRAISDISAFGGLPRHSFFGFYNCKEHGFSLNGKLS